MFLIFGLGNPGKKYKKTRHNAGFLFLDFLAKKYNFSKFTFKKNLEASLSQGKIGEKNIILAKPRTFMNNSGRAAKKIIEKFKVNLENFLVVHDDLDFPIGKVKISKGKGPGGHKGVKSILEELKTKDFWRLRIGISPKKGRPKNFEKFVLKKFGKEEEKFLRLAMEEGLKEIFLKFNFKI